MLTAASGCPVFGGTGADTTMVRHSAIRSFHLPPTPSLPLAGCLPTSRLFCSAPPPWLGHGAPHGGTCFPHSTWPVKCISFALVSRICYWVKQTPRPNPKTLPETLAFSSPIQLKKPIQHLYPLKAACTKSSHLTLLFSIIGAEQALFPREVSSPATGQVSLSFSGFSPAFQQPSKKRRSEPGTQAAPGQAPHHSGCSSTAPWHSQRWQCSS